MTRPQAATFIPASPALTVAFLTGAPRWPIP